MMTKPGKEIPLQTLHLFPVLDALLITLLNSLQEHEWTLPTIAKLWSVKDIAAHLLDGNLRALSTSRDQFFTVPNQPVQSYADLLIYLNELNAQWITAAKRLSPRVITDLLETTGKAYFEQLKTLNAFDDAIFSVVWAGEDQSANWFHIAREYTEKFIHQQQIREAVNKPGLYTRELFYPFIDTFLYALPYTYKNTDAADETTVQVKVTTEIGGQWTIIKSARAGSGQTNRLQMQTLPSSLILKRHGNFFPKGLQLLKR